MMFYMNVNIYHADLVTSLIKLRTLKNEETSLRTNRKFICCPKLTIKIYCLAVTSLDFKNLSEQINNKVHNYKSEFIFCNFKVAEFLKCRFYLINPDEAYC